MSNRSMSGRSISSLGLLLRTCALGGQLAALGLMATPLTAARPQAPETRAAEPKPQNEAKDPASPKKHAYLKKRTGHGGDPAHRKPTPKPTPKPAPKKAPKAPAPHAPAPHAPTPHPGVPK